MWIKYLTIVFLPTKMSLFSMRKLRNFFFWWGFPYKILAWHLLTPTTSEAKWEDNRLLMHTKRIKSYTPLHLHIRLFKRFQKGGRGRLESRGVCNLICRSLFYYYGDLFYYLLSTSVLCFLLREMGRDSERERREARRGERRKRRRKTGRGALASPVKQILVILALLIYKILKRTLVL